VSKQFDICFVGLKCYDLIAGADTPRYLGGIEKQIVSLARGFVAAGYKVAFITFDHGQADAIEHDGITVFKAYDAEAGLPLLRFWFPRMSGLWQAMARANANVYMQMGASDETGRVAMGLSRLKGGRKFVFLAASDGDCYANLPALTTRHERMLYHFGLKKADLVLVQTQSQRKMYEDNFSVSSEVLPMPYVDNNSCELNAEDVRTQHHHVFWAGRIVEVKRLEWLLDIAQMCPDVMFDVVGSPNDGSAYFEALKERASGINNVTLHGRVTEGELSGFFRHSSLLCCTSIVEGFPTTFLEAWAAGLPVVTSFDPDGVIAREGLGRVADTQEALAANIRELLETPEVLIQESAKLRDYFEKTHSVGAVIPRCEALFENAFGGLARNKM